ncbi:MAG: glycosyltransferase family 4 protein [Candidatus Nomurabacteria bacterium]|jgi:glycosyltransferase involved in cell wall biosynthesis|nr:glycosyltransferase family 4 protein [Candidatus Nomurabacteria bacterium]
MSHIVIDARIINSSTGRYIERLLTYLEKIDKTNNYTILVPSVDIYCWKPANKNFRVMPADFKNYSISEQLGFNKFLNSLQADLVHFCMPQQPVLYRKNKVTTVHDLILFNTYNSDKNWLLFHIKQAIGRLVFKSVGKRSTVVITPSQYTKRDFVKFARIPEDKARVIYDAADKVGVKSRTYKLPFKKYLLYVGSQTDYKNIKRLITAHQKVRDTYDRNLGLVLVGRKSYYTEKHEEFTNKIGAEGVLFTGFLPDDQLAYLYKNAAAYVFPSLMEGFGLPGLEAMQFGTPVISSYATCLPEIYGGSAIYFNPTDPDDMADRIISVLSDKKLLKDLSKRSKERVKDFSWERCARETHQAYLDALGQKK